MMKNFKDPNNKIKKVGGSVALLSVLIISAILIIAIISNAEIQSNTSRQYLNQSFKQSLYYLAEACVEDAIVQLERNPDYNEGSLNIGNAGCNILINGENPKNITINVNDGNYSQDFSAEISMETIGLANNAELIKWQEV